MTPRPQTNRYCSWRTPPQDIHLHENQVDIWLVPLDEGKSRINEFANVLSGKEIKRAGRFHSHDLKNRFIAARALLRFILAGYLNVSPEKITFHFDDYGKPSLAGTFSNTGLCFNVSHSHGMALYGITLRRDIGVDIEKVRPDYSFEKIARRQFAPSELKLFQELPECEKIRTFFTWWTRKESLVKAIGKGLHLSMKAFDVSGTMCESVRFNAWSDAAGETEWVVEDLEIGSDYCAAFAVGGRFQELRFYNGSGTYLVT